MKKNTMFRRFVWLFERKKWRPVVFFWFFLHRKPFKNHSKRFLKNQEKPIKNHLKYRISKNYVLSFFLKKNLKK
jgi:hypothetical protein